MDGWMDGWMEGENRWVGRMVGLKRLLHGWMIKLYFHIFLSFFPHESQIDSRV